MHFADLAEINDLSACLEEPGRAARDAARGARLATGPYLRIGADHTVPYMRGLAMVAANYGLRDAQPRHRLADRPDGGWTTRPRSSSVRGAAHALSEFVERGV